MTQIACLSKSNGGIASTPYLGLEEFQGEWPARERGTSASPIGSGRRSAMPNLKDYPPTKTGLEFYVRHLTQYFMVKTLESSEWKDFVKAQTTNLFRDQIKFLVDEEIQTAVTEFRRNIEEHRADESDLDPDYDYLNLEARVQIPQSLNWSTVPKKGGMYPEIEVLAHDWDVTEEQ